MISVIIPIYNAEKTLKRLIDNLLMQTYSELEVLLIDDGSADNTGQICEEIVEKDKRFRYFHQDNSGVSTARNLGLEQANGEFIAFLDADDSIDDNYFEELITACQGADAAVCTVNLEDESGKILSKFTLPNQTLVSTEALNYLLKRRCINSGPCAKLFRRTVLDRLRFPTLKVYEDILFVIHAFANAQLIGITDKTRYHYYQHDDSAMHRAVKAPPLDIVFATDYIMDFIVHYEILEDQCTYITLSHLFQYVQISIQMNQKNTSFLRAVRHLFWKYKGQLLFCKSFPAKEKIVYIFFLLGWLYQNKKFIKIR